MGAHHGRTHIHSVRTAGRATLTLSRENTQPRKYLTRPGRLRSRFMLTIPDKPYYLMCNIPIGEKSDRAAAYPETAIGGADETRTRDLLRDRQLQKIYLVAPSSFVLRHGTRFWT